MIYPLRHISIRVPWHDSGWNAAVCKAPELNGACALLKRISGSKNDEREQKYAGQQLADIPMNVWPPCIDERGSFMAPYELDHIRRHALADQNPTHYGHFRPTRQRMPAYSAGVVPFFWMMRSNTDSLASQLSVDVDLAREPDLGYETNWVHEADNQANLLDAFAGHLKPESSLCFYYAKHVPFVEGTGRFLIGVGRVKAIGPLTEYAREGEGMRGMLWERPIQHSIRPKQDDGFLIPYPDILRKLEEDPSIDISRYVPHAPSEHWNEFSFASELVTHDGGIGALLSICVALERTQKELGIDTTRQQQWVHDELVRLWTVRGPYPGLGAVFRAFGLSQGLFVAHALQEKAGVNADPWPLVDAAFDKPSTVLPTNLHRDLKELSSTWLNLTEQRRKMLKLLSRFELTVDQARKLYDESSRKKAGWDSSDIELLRDPYRIYEVSRHDVDPVRLRIVDRGIFPDDSVRGAHTIEEPSRLDSAIDMRRVRAFSIEVLEEAAAAGHTLHFLPDLAEAVRNASAQPDCPVTADFLNANLEGFKPEIVSLRMSGGVALQLTRYEQHRNIIRKNVLDRIAGKRHAGGPDWVSLLFKRFGKLTDEDENCARQEKSAALREIFESRFSVLAGPAGAGKTTVLGLLCAQDEIKREGILLLAPTGKARVRMQQLAGEAGTEAKTIAQFLNQAGRYDGQTGRYFVCNKPKMTGYATVIVDEASMLTEDMLGAVIDALQGVKRLILVGDPAQLPPIGAGRPFVDIVRRLRPDNYESVFPRIAQGYAELTIERRQTGIDRPDLRLARWFGSGSPSAGEDDVFEVGETEYPSLRFVRWDDPRELQGKLIQVLSEELKLASTEDVRGFNQAMGSVSKGDYDYFNASRSGQFGSVDAIEKWQVLSPVRSLPYGVSGMNRLIHERFRRNFLDLATRRRRSIPKPMGAERIVYGDKVINLSNHRRDGRKV